MIKSIDFPLKFSVPLDIFKSYQQYVLAHYDPVEFKNIEETLIDIQKQRATLDYQILSNQIFNDYKLCDEVEQKIVKYYRYISLLDSVFKSGFSESKNKLNCNFAFTDSFNPSKKPIAVNNSKYELICSLYNLAIIYYQNSSCLAISLKDEDKLMAISKLQRAYWCMAEIKQLLPGLLADTKNLPTDLDPTIITVLSNYFIGLAYHNLSNIMASKSSKNEMRLASLNKSASQNFQVAYDILEANSKTPYPDFISKRLKATLLYYAVIHRAQAYNFIAQTRLKLVDEELLKGHLGLAVSYLRLAKTDLDIFRSKKGSSDYLSPEQRDEIARLTQATFNTYNIQKERNDKVYHQAEFDASKLPEIPDETKMIAALEPKTIKEKLSEEKFFTGFLSAEVLALKQEFLNIVSLRILELENSVKDANNTKKKLYSDGFVNYLIDLANSNGGKQADIPPQLLQRIEQFHRNGAFPNYEKIKLNIQESAKMSLDCINDIKGLLAKEKEDDELCRLQYPQKWNRPISEQINFEYVFQLKGIF